MDDEERQKWLKACWSDKCLAITEHMRLYYVVGEMMDVLGAHGTICARDDRVQAVMDALYEIDGGNRMTPNDLGNRRDAGPIGGASVLTDELERKRDTRCG